MTMRLTFKRIFQGAPWLRYVFFAALGGFLFVYGVGVGRYEWPPFQTLFYLKSSAGSIWQKEPVGYKGEQELLQYAFTDPVIPGELLYHPITTLEDIRLANHRIFMKTAGFETAYEELEVVKARQIEINGGKTAVVQLTFNYQGRYYKAYAYGKMPKLCANTGSASLVIPGSGLNQSQGIATGDQGNYHHGILDALNKGGGGENLYFY